MTKTVQQKESELQERYEEHLESSTIPPQLFTTGLLNGTVVDITPSDEHVAFTIRLDSGDRITVTAEDDGSYDADNELTRILEHYNIVDGQLSNLLYEEVTIQLDELSNYESLSDNEFSIYTGHEKRKLIHNLGVPQYRDSVDTLSPLVFALGLAIYLSFLLPSVIAVGLAFVFLLNSQRVLRYLERRGKELATV